MVVLSIMLLLGCEHKQTSDDYKDKYDNLQTQAIKECSDHGQKYVQHFTRDLVTWECLCVTENPLMFHTIVLK